MTDMLRLAEETFKLVQIYAIIEEQAITKKIRFTFGYENLKYASKFW